MKPEEIRIQCRAAVHPDCYNDKLVIDSVYAQGAESDWDAITNYQADGTFRYTEPPQGTIVCDPCMLEQESQRGDLTPLQKRIFGLMGQSN